MRQGRDEPSTPPGESAPDTPEWMDTLFTQLGQRGKAMSHDESAGRDPAEELRSALAGRYVLEKEVGRGGMATVFKAWDPRHKRPLAIKMMRPELRSALGSRRFLQEIRITAGLQHPHILTLIDSGESGGILYYVMPFVEGETLQQRLRDEGALPQKEAVRIAQLVAAALDHAHRHGVVHRDVKPSNILLCDGEPIIMDFGIARALQSAVDEALTSAGVSVGTPIYMSPEQLRADPDVDGRSDVYSLGCVLYEMLTGVQAFTGSSLESLITQRLQGEPPTPSRSNPQIPAWLDRIVARAMMHDRRDRWESAAALADALRSPARSPTPAAATEAGEPRGAERLDSLAVLPFVNESADPDADFLSDGLTDTLIDNLCRLPQLRVMARSTMFRFRDREITPQQIGESLDVRAVVTGRLLRRRDQLVIRAELVDTCDGKRLWGGHFKRPVADLIAIEDEIAREISENLRLELNPEEKKRLTRRRMENPEAHQAYLQGRFVWSRWKTPEGMKTAIGFFERALSLDPLHARAFAGLADSYSMLGNVKALPPDEAYPKAKTAARQGLAIDDGLAELHTSLAFVQRFWEWDWAASEASFRRAISLNPGYAIAHRFYAQLLTGLGRHDEAIARGRRALEHDPLSLIIRGAVGDLFFYARRYDEAIDYYRRTIEMDPDFLAGHTDLARAYELAGRYDDAIEEFRKAAALAPKGLPEPSSGLAHVYAQMGRRDDALAIVDELKAMRKTRYISPYGIASIYSCLREIDTAFEWLGRAYEEHDQTLVWVKVHPRLDPLRSDSRFDDLLRKMNLAD